MTRVRGKRKFATNKPRARRARGLSASGSGFISGKLPMIKDKGSIFVEYTISYRTNYRLNILSPNYRHIVYEIIIGKFQLIVANVT